jgi:hypothetical protein
MRGVTFIALMILRAASGLLTLFGMGVLVGSVIVGYWWGFSTYDLTPHVAACDHRQLDLCLGGVLRVTLLPLYAKIFGCIAVGAVVAGWFRRVGDFFAF